MLSLKGTNVTGAGLAHGLTGMKELSFYRAKLVNDAGLAQLKGMTKLERLDLRETEVTDAGLAHLKGLNGMQMLDLGYNTKITDAGLVHLKGLTGMKGLGLWGTKVTAAGVMKLKLALPDCVITIGSVETEARKF